MEFTFSDVGEGITEGVVVRWHVEVGDRVEEDQTLLEVETDKAVVEIPSPTDAQVKSIPVAAGDRVRVGETLVVFEEDDPSPGGSPDSEDEETLTLDLPDEENATVVGRVPSEEEVLEEPSTGTVLATPSTRRLARELGVDLGSVSPSSKNGRITEEDVRRAAREGDERPDPDAHEHGPVQFEPISEIRRSIAQKMSRSTREIPHATHMDRADVTRLKEWLASRDDDAEPKLTLTPLLVKACADVLREHPRVNASFDSENERIILKQYYNIGVSVDTEHGLMVPVLKKVDEKDVIEIAGELAELAGRARNRRIQPAEMRGGTFTLTNIGSIGGEWSRPIINPPEAAILATGQAREQAVVREGAIEPRSMLPLSVSFDHRILDGSDVARFTNGVIARLEQSPDEWVGS